MKWCNACQQSKPFAEFNRCRRFKDGHQYTCRACEKVRKSGRAQAVLVPSDHLCECGCGQVTNLVYNTAREFGVTKGEPRRFLPGHGSRVASPEARERLRVASAAFAQTRKGKPGTLRGDRHPSWKGGRWIDRRGYVYVYRPGHHLSNRSGHAREHRLVMEEKLGRPLRANEHVHHIDGNRANNTPENLVALTVSEHAKLHRVREFRRERERGAANH